MRAASDIQFAPVGPVVPPKPPVPPEWLLRFGEWLQKLFGGLGDWFGIPWPVFEKILIGLAIVGAPGDPAVDRALAELEFHSAKLLMLGTYRQARVRG